MHTYYTTLMPSTFNLDSAEVTLIIIPQPRTHTRTHTQATEQGSPPHQLYGRLEVVASLLDEFNSKGVRGLIVTLGRLNEIHEDDVDYFCVRGFPFLEERG